MELLTGHEKAIGERKALEEEFQERSLAAMIEVTGKIYAKTLVRIGNHTTTVEEDAIQVKFFLAQENEDEEIQLKMTSL